MKKATFTALNGLEVKLNKKEFSGYGILFLMKQEKDGMHVGAMEYADDLEVRALELLDEAWTEEEKTTVFILILPSELAPEWTKFALDVYRNGISEADESGRMGRIFGKEIAASKSFADWIWKNIQYTAGSMFHPILRWDRALPDVAAISKVANAVETEAPLKPKASAKPVQAPAKTVPEAPAKKAEPDMPDAAFWAEGVYYLKPGTGIDAQMKPWKDCFVLRAGSVIAPTYRVTARAGHVEACRKKYAGCIQDGKTTRDLLLDRIGHISGFVYGRRETHASCWKMADGTRFGEEAPQAPAQQAKPKQAAKPTALKVQMPKGVGFQTEGFALDANLPEEFTVKFNDILAVGRFAGEGKGFILRRGSKSNPDRDGIALPEGRRRYKEAIKQGLINADGVLQKDILFDSPMDALAFIANGRAVKYLPWDNVSGTGRSFKECAKLSLAK